MFIVLRWNMFHLTKSNLRIATCTYCIGISRFFLSNLIGDIRTRCESMHPITYRNSHHGLIVIRSRYQIWIWSPSNIQHRIRQVVESPKFIIGICSADQIIVQVWYTHKVDNIVRFTFGWPIKRKRRAHSYLCDSWNIVYWLNSSF